MNRKILKDTLGWGILLWAFGYILGIALFMFVPSSAIGWIITPFGVLVALFILLKKISGTLKHYLLISISWTSVAIILDYFLLVKLFKPSDGYYKLDVYLYYILTFTLPLIVGWYKNSKFK